MLASSARRVKNMLAMAQAGGEPMKSCFSEAALTILLDAHGFLIYALQTPEEIQARYFDVCRPRLRAFEHTNFVMAALDRR